MPVLLHVRPASGVVAGGAEKEGPPLGGELAEEADLPVSNVAEGQGAAARGSGGAPHAKKMPLVTGRDQIPGVVMETVGATRMVHGVESEYKC